MKQIALVTVALAAGFVGGAAGGRFTRTLERSHPESVVRARSFELVDEAGRAISYWGIDKNQNAVLAFGSHWPEESKKDGDSRTRPPAPLGELHNQRAAIGVIDDSGFLSLKGTDGKPRAELYLNAHGKPGLLMGDETGPRMLLGVETSDTPGPEDNNWVLRFVPDRARIGVFTEKINGKTYVRGGFAVNRDKVEYPDFPLDQYKQRK